MANIHGNWTSGSNGDVVVSHISYLELYQSISSVLVEGIMRNNSVKLF